jgi:hypothetical protein
MADPQDRDVEMEDDYDEAADSDFDATSVKSNESGSSSADEGDEADAVDDEANARAQKRRKTKPTPPAADEHLELDSGDEVTIKEHKKERRRQRKKGEDVEPEEDKEEGWRARTRAMREREVEERKQNKLASIRGSTIDVNKIWEEMNRPASLQPPAPSGTKLIEELPSTDAPGRERVENHEQEMITINRTYRFAGEVQTETKTVPKDSAEAKLWLAQQEQSSSTSKAQALDAEGKIIHRPLRKISRFDPNVSNLEAFKGAWTSTSQRSTTAATGPKLNVVEKSKMDWALHVDSAGLQEELSEAAKAKTSYLNRTDFLRQVEQRKEEDARAARLRGV